MYYKYIKIFMTPNFRKAVKIKKNVKRFFNKQVEFLIQDGDIYNTYKYNLEGWLEEYLTESDSLIHLVNYKWSW